MKQNFLTFTSFSAFLLVILYCGSALEVISRKDQGKTITMPPDTGFDVELKANPSTGFSWEILSIDSNIIKAGKRTFWADDTIPGSAGIDHISFSTLKKGTSLLKLGYLRTFEGIGSMADSFEVCIQVR